MRTNGRPQWVTAFVVAAWFGILASIGGGVLALYWMLRPYHGLTVAPHGMGIDKGTVEAGDLIRYSWSYCVDTALPVPITIDRELELQAGDGIIFAVSPPMSYQIEARCEARTVFLGIPSYLPAGMYHLHMHTTLRVNPLREIRQNFESEKFIVVVKARLP